MATFQTFVDIEVWQKARELVSEVYRISKHGSFSKDFGLQRQIRDASVSIMANIAEGFERSGTAEFAQFLSIAKGSVGEVISHAYVALDQEYITKTEFARLIGLATATIRLIGGLMSYLRRSGIKGTKFLVSSIPKTRNT